MEDTETNNQEPDSYLSGFDYGYTNGQVALFNIDETAYFDKLFSEYELGLMDGVMQLHRDEERQQELLAFDHYIQKEHKNEQGAEGQIERD